MSLYERRKKLEEELAKLKQEERDNKIQDILDEKYKFIRDNKKEVEKLVHGICNILSESQIINKINIDIDDLPQEWYSENTLSLFQEVTPNGFKSFFTEADYQSGIYEIGIQKLND